MNLENLLARKGLFVTILALTAIVIFVRLNPELFSGSISGSANHLETAYAPQTGNQKLLVILVDFPDRPGAINGEAWQEFFTNEHGFNDFYLENSYGQLRYEVDIVGMLNGQTQLNNPAKNYVRLDHPVSYYADDQYGFGPNLPQNTSGVTLHALQKLDAAGFDFSPYADEKKNIHNLIVIFAGSPYDESKDP
ncbi:MAG: hypothetical protein AAGD96_35895, partial [Chloroflexota bacterium]